MTPIGSTSSNIRRAIAFMVDLSLCNLGVRADAHDGLDEYAPRNSSGELIAPLDRTSQHSRGRRMVAAMANRIERGPFLVRIRRVRLACGDRACAECARGAFRPCAD